MTSTPSGVPSPKTTEVMVMLTVSQIPSSDNSVGRWTEARLSKATFPIAAATGVRELLFQTGLDGRAKMMGQRARVSDGRRGIRELRRGLVKPRPGAAVLGVQDYR